MIYAAEQEGTGIKKVGMSRNVSARRLELPRKYGGTWSILMVVPGYFIRENATHRLLAPYRVRGELYDADIETINRAFTEAGTMEFVVMEMEFRDAGYTLSRVAARIGCSAAHLSRMMSGDDPMYQWARRGVEGMLCEIRGGPTYVAEPHEKVLGNPRILNDDQVREILRRAEAGENQTELGREYGVNQTMVSAIKMGRGRFRFFLSDLGDS
jgi:hypothetical protein